MTKLKDAEIENGFSGFTRYLNSMVGPEVNIGQNKEFVRNLIFTTQASQIKLFDSVKEFVADFNFDREYKLQSRFAKNVPQPLLRNMIL